MSEEAVEDTSEYSGCEHYKRKCKLVSPCCNKVYSCRFCHDDEESGLKGHTIDRRKVEEVVCGRCDQRQSIGAKCQGCAIVFGSAYFCGVCKLFDDVDKGQFHCDGCGICRIGGREKYEHCSTCGLCLPHDTFTSHKCIRDTSHNNCPVCMEDIHNSRDGAHIPPCSHLLHQSCYSNMLKQGLYSCPTCGHAMVDMSRAWQNVDREVAATPMPREYADLYREILCRDCNKKSTVLFHIVGMKCGEEGCGSYNTSLEGGPLLRRVVNSDDNTVIYTPLTDQELSALTRRVTVMMAGRQLRRSVITMMRSLVTMVTLMMTPITDTIAALLSFLGLARR